MQSTHGLTDSTWVVCPAFNEAKTLGAVLLGLRAESYRVVVVDDGSSDDTVNIAAELASAIVTHAVNLGQGAAIKTGIDYALSRGAEYLVTFDSDGQHRPSDIARLLDALVRNQVDFALGSRFLAKPQSMPLVRKLLLRAATLFTSLTTGLYLTDTHNGLRAFTRRGAMALNFRQNRMAHASEILSDLAASKLRYVEVPVTIDYTEYSMTKGQRTSDLILVLVDLFARKLHR